jgi:NAD(P)-dependent dehydrogenase (short-subunit alcohol dehydrogenase family)
MPEAAGPADRLIVLAGGTSAVGRSVARHLLDAGARVVVVGREPKRLADVEGELLATPVAGTLAVEACDLTDETAVTALAERVHSAHGAIDGLIHLVGGWRGGAGLAGQSEANYRFLEAGFTALRHTSRAFDADLRASEAGRLAIVSSPAVARPLAGGANYAAVKAASEAWTRAVAHGFARDARERAEGLHAAAVIFRVKALTGLEAALAARVVSLWHESAPSLNDTTREIESAESSRS